MPWNGFNRFSTLKGQFTWKVFSRFSTLKGQFTWNVFSRFSTFKDRFTWNVFSRFSTLKGQFTWKVFSRFSLFSHASSMIFPLAPCRKPTSDLGVLLRQKKAVIHSKFTSFCICFRRIFCKVNVPD